MWPLPARLPSVAPVCIVATAAFVRIMQPPPPGDSSAFMGTPALRSSLPFWFIPPPLSDPSGNSSLSIDPKQSRLFPEITSMTLFFCAAFTTAVYCSRHLRAVVCDACLLLRVTSLRVEQCLSYSPRCLQEMAPCLARCRD